MAGGKRGCLFGLLLGSVIKLCMGLFKGIIYIVSWSILYLGLWAPILYSLAGLVLYFTLSFNPFDWTALGQLYFAGFLGTAVLALIITIRNVIIKPLKSVSDGYKNPLWRKKPETEEPQKDKKKAKPEPDSFPDRAENLRRAPVEDPIVYESELEQGSIIHEFHDRFEVYVLKGGRLVLDKVEMKNEEY